MVWTNQIIKEKEEKEDKVCNICKLVIDESKEFARFTHFKNKKEVLSEAYYHINCFRERMLGSAENRKIQKDAKQIIDFAKQRLGISEVIA